MTETDNEPTLLRPLFFIPLRCVYAPPLVCAMMVVTVLGWCTRIVLAGQLQHCCTTNTPFGGVLSDLLLRSGGVGVAGGMEMGRFDATLTSLLEKKKIEVAGAKLGAR